MAIDFFGRALEVGDTVAFMLVRYRSLQEGIILSISPKKCKIGYFDTATTQQLHNQVIKKV